MTPQPASLKAVETFDLRCGTVIPLCDQCRAVRVDKPGQICIPCRAVLINRGKMLKDQRATQRTIKHAFIISAVLLIVCLAAALWLMSAAAVK